MARYRLGLEQLEDRTLPTAAQYVTSLYGDFLNRTPSQAEVSGFVNLLNTGTPAGVGMGQDPPVYLKDGDVLELEVEGLGRQRSNVRQGRSVGQCRTTGAASGAPSSRCDSSRRRGRKNAGTKVSATRTAATQ